MSDVPTHVVTRAHAAVHLDVGRIDPLFCHHPDGRISIRVCDGPLHVWITGTPNQLHEFASTLHRLANRAVAEMPKRADASSRGAEGMGWPTQLAVSASPANGPEAAS